MNGKNQTDGETSGNFIADLFARFGLRATKTLCAVLLALFGAVKLVLGELWALLLDILRGLKFLAGCLTESVRNRISKNKELQKEVRRAKKAGKKEYFGALAKFAGSFLFGEDGILYAVFNYALPIFSIAFLIGIVRIGSGSRYGVAVKFNGKELGIVDSEADFEEAEREVRQRIAFIDDDKALELSADISLKAITDSDRILTKEQLANEMLAASNEELSEAYGVYVDGKFVGAVKEKESVQNALDDRLLNYRVEGAVKDVSYKNKIEFKEGYYLADSVKKESDAIALLTSSKEKKGVYVAQSGDSAVAVAQKYNMDVEKFEAMNPGVKSELRGGQIVNVVETESYLPIQYVKEFETLSLLDYETVETETSALNVGTKAVLVKGRYGERRSVVEATYVDGVERSRRTASSKVTKQPVVEQIGIGTYAAKPDPGVRTLTGSGEFSWPVDGGFISDIFGGARNHKGMDIAASEGTEIYAAADGEVVAAGWNPGGYGYFVQIDHLDGYQTVYGHMSQVFVSAGQPVGRGQLIGAVGNTGHSFGAHCHFEVRLNGICRDPELYLNTMNDPSVSEEEDEDEDDEDE